MVNLTDLGLSVNNIVMPLAQVLNEDLDTIYLVDNQTIRLLTRVGSEIVFYLLPTQLIKRHTHQSNQVGENVGLKLGNPVK